MKKIGKEWAAVCITINFSEPQNPRFIIESSFKSRAGHNGTGTVIIECPLLGFLEIVIE